MKNGILYNNRQNVTFDQENLEGLKFKGKFDYLLKIKNFKRTHLYSPKEFKKYESLHHSRFSKNSNLYSIIIKVTQHFTSQELLFWHLNQGDKTNTSVNEHFFPNNKFDIPKKKKQILNKISKEANTFLKGSKFVFKAVKLEVEFVDTNLQKTIQEKVLEIVAVEKKNQRTPEQIVLGHLHNPASAEQKGVIKSCTQRTESNKQDL